MILGMSTHAFTVFHVALSLIGIASGAVVGVGMWRARPTPVWTSLFLITTIATSATGFLFHSKSIGPPHVLGVISLVVLGFAVIALYRHRLSGRWRWIYVASALAAVYFNVFVGIVQAFQKVAPLKTLAPTGSEPPFVITQLLVLVGFVAFGIAAVRRFHPQMPGAVQA